MWRVKLRFRVRWTIFALSKTITTRYRQPRWTFRPFTLKILKVNELKCFLIEFNCITNLFKKKIWKANKTDTTLTSFKNGDLTHSDEYLNGVRPETTTPLKMINTNANNYMYLFNTNEDCDSNYEKTSIQNWDLNLKLEKK